MRRCAAAVWRTGLALGLAASLGVGVGGCRRSQGLVIRLSHITAPGSSWDAGARRFAELVAQRSGGRIRVDVFPGGQLAQYNQKTEVQQLCAGSLEMTLNSPIILALFLDKRFDAFSLPWLFPDHATAHRICDGPFGQRALGWLEEHDVHGIAYGVNGFRQLTNSVRPVHAPADLRGLKIRVAGTDLFRAVFAAFGANPTTMNFGEVFTALQQKTIDGQENPLSIIASSKLYEVQKHLTLWNYAYDPLILTCNRRFWEGLAPADRGLITQCGTEAMAHQRQVVADEDVRLVEEMRRQGVEVVTLSPAEVQAFRDACAGVYFEFSSKIGKEVVDELRAEVQKVAPPPPAP